jgi:hypothetical protein
MSNLNVGRIFCAENPRYQEIRIYSFMAFTRSGFPLFSFPGNLSA